MYTVRTKQESLLVNSDITSRLNLIYLTNIISMVLQPVQNALVYSLRSFIADVRLGIHVDKN